MKLKILSNKPKNHNLH